MDNNFDDIPSEFKPENDSAPSEFNPYGSFLEENEPEPEATDIHNTENNFENVEKLNKKETTEEDINIPDFMNVTISENENIAKENNTAPQIEQQDEFNPEENYNSEILNTLDNFKEDSSSDNSYSGTDTAVPESNSGGSTEDEKPDEIFESKLNKHDKTPKSKPKVLNKKFLLSAIIIVFGLVFLSTFLAPTKKIKSNKNEKPVAEKHSTTDYSSLATRPIDNSQTHYEDVSVSSPEEPKKEEVEIPPVVPQPSNEKAPYTPNNVSYNTGKGTGSSSSVEIPDTRNDSLQGKRISGIKGLSSTQESYSTDYHQTIAKNTTSTGNTGGYTLPSKEEYMNNVLGAYSQAYGNATSQNNSYAVQNDQAGKNSFYNNGRNGSNVGQGEYLNLNTLWQGTIFEAVLTSEINTDLPGEITARISKNIYSSQDGRFLLIPQNSVVYGTYNSSISYSQSRVQVAWHTLIRPDGYQIQLGNMNGTDAKGASGLKGFVNDHPLAYLKAIGLMSAFSIVNTEFSKQMGNTQNEYVQDLLANSQNVTVELGDKLIDRAMNVQPTIKIKSGTKINIVVNQNLTLPPCEDIPVTQAYHKE